jgi:putative endonuclease
MKYNKMYVGFTSDFESRFLSHNLLSTKGYTLKYRPWALIHREEFDQKSMAMIREKYFKSGVGRQWIKLHLGVVKQ